MNGLVTISIMILVLGLALETLVRARRRGAPAGGHCPNCREDEPGDLYVRRRYGECMGREFFNAHEIDEEKVICGVCGHVGEPEDF